MRGCAPRRFLAVVVFAHARAYTFSVSFWQEIKKPIRALAPMHEVTDTAFRQVVARIAKPDVLFTEFVSVDGLCHEKSHEKIVRYYLSFTDSERPLVAQLWGSDPKKFNQVAHMVQQLGFDGIDINMGCPDKAVVKSGGGAALIEQPRLAQEIIAATKEGARDLPVSVKTRIGFEKNEIESWMKALLEARPVVITVHGRTKKELSRVVARWDVIAQAADIARGSGVLVIGNGDVKTMDDAWIKISQSGVDGVMVGRGLLGNPWFFSETVPSLEDRLNAIVLHAHIFEESFDGVKSFAHLLKHLHAYAAGFVGAKDLRMQLMRATNAQEVAQIVGAWRGVHGA